MEECKIKNMYDLNHTIAKELLEKHLKMYNVKYIHSIDVAYDSKRVGIDLNLFNYYYDKDTFDFYVNQSLYEDERHLAWGKNLLLTHLDLSDIIETLRHKSNWENLYPVIEQLNQILVNEQNQQAKVVNEEIHHLKKLNSWIKSLYKK